MQIRYIADKKIQKKNVSNMRSELDTILFVSTSPLPPDYGSFASSVCIKKYVPGDSRSQAPDVDQKFPTLYDSNNDY